jgi:hypothetical protein
MSQQPSSATTAVHVVANQRAAALIALVGTCAAGLSLFVLNDAPTPKGGNVVSAQSGEAPATSAADTVASVASSSLPVADTVPTVVPGVNSTAVATPVVVPGPAAPQGAATPQPAAPQPAPAAPAGPANTPGPTPAPATTRPVTTPPTTKPPATSPPAATAPAATPPPTTAAAQVTYSSYAFSGVATSIVIAESGANAISVSSITKEANWVSRIDRNGPKEIEIGFFNTVTEQEAHFNAHIENGRITVERGF